MDTVLAVIGAATGSVSLLAMVVWLGVYKERVDRHERWLSLLVDEALVRAWKGGTVERGSWKAAPQFVASLPQEARDICAEAAKLANHTAFSDVARAVMKVADRRGMDLGELAVTMDSSPMELLGTLTVYAAQLADSKGHDRGTP